MVLISEDLLLSTTFTSRVLGVSNVTTLAVSLLALELELALSEALDLGILADGECPGEVVEDLSGKLCRVRNAIIYFWCYFNLECSSVSSTLLHGLS